jgi:hypothetical protein
VYKDLSANRQFGEEQTTPLHSVVGEVFGVNVSGGIPKVIDKIVIRGKHFSKTD